VSAKGTQEERLIEAMIDLCAQTGYLSVSVAELSAHAGVSSKTFYELFDDKEDCLLAAYRAAATRVLANVEPVAEHGDWGEAARSVIESLLVALQGDPSGGRLLMVEALAGGARVRGERERVLGAFEQRAQQFLDSAPRDGKTLDLPATAVIGAVRSLVSRYLRTYSEDRLPTLVDDLLAWLDSYAVPVGKTPWSTGPHSVLPRGNILAPSLARAIPTPARLPRGRHGLSAGAVARSQRTRIIHGTAEVMMTKGYAEATVSEIVAAAGISREVFYAYFANKQHAFLAAQQYATQFILEVCTAAYFSRDSWPERVWVALDALIGLLAANPSLAHLRLVECYAAGPAAIEHTEQLKRVAAIFLEEGYNLNPKARSLPHLSSHAIAGAVFEVFYGHISRGEIEKLPTCLPQLAYIAIAPFVGPEQAIEALEKMRAETIAAESARARSRRGA
jgi:AcrR family transcriptional regulator